jgi:hypothetical protein
MFYSGRLSNSDLCPTSGYSETRIASVGIDYFSITRNRRPVVIMIVFIASLADFCANLWITGTTINTITVVTMAAIHCSRRL